MFLGSISRFSFSLSLSLPAMASANQPASPAGGGASTSQCGFQTVGEIGKKSGHHQASTESEESEESDLGV